MLPTLRFFFILGGLITLLFPLLIYSRFAFAVSWHWRPAWHSIKLCTVAYVASWSPGDLAGLCTFAWQRFTENPAAYGGTDRHGHQRHLSHLGWSEPSSLDTREAVES